MFAIEDVLKISGGRFYGEEKSLQISGVSIDSRTIKAGDMFVAFKGEKTDGHDYLKEVFAKGAQCAMVERACENTGPLIQVPNVLNAIQSLAKWHRMNFQIPVIAVTGSAGKTTTKECVGIALSEKFKVKTSHANWNNHLGVPLNLLNLQPEDECLVIELGANHSGEISFLSDLVVPTVGIITGVYPVHLEGFGSMDGIYRAKLELADYLIQSNKTIFANGDDPELIKRLHEKKAKLVTFGSRSDCDYFISEVIFDDGFLKFNVNRKYQFTLKGYGLFNAKNALAAIAVADFFGINLNSLSENWRSLPVIQSRFRITKFDKFDIEIIDDAYNANPHSFKTALESFVRLNFGAKRKIVIAGDMLELGDGSVTYHQQLGKIFADSGIDLLVGVGKLSAHTVEFFKQFRPQSDAYFFENFTEVNRFILPIIKPGDRVLIKGSHGIHLENVSKEIETKFSNQSLLV